jgi:hypothetical protein
LLEFDSQVRFWVNVPFASRRICHCILESPVSRRKLLLVFPVVLILVGAALLFERPAYAYADPGTGLLAVQAAGSALVATGWYLRRKIYSLFHSSEAPAPEADKQSTVADGEDMPNL